MRQRAGHRANDDGRRGRVRSTWALCSRQGHASRSPGAFLLLVLLLFGVSWLPALAKTPPVDEVDPPQLHASLGRPIANPYNNAVDYVYPYGSTLNGKYRIHTGVEISNPMGTPVLAVGDGSVAYAGTDREQLFGPRTNFYGNMVILRVDGDHRGKAVFVLYAHLSKMVVRQGQRVAAGQVIGAVGMSGAAAGPHLHLEVRLGSYDYDSTRNPVLWLKPFSNHGTIAGRLVDAAGRPLAAGAVLIYPASTPSRLLRVVQTYEAGEIVNPDDDLGENFATLDVPAGDYILVGSAGGRSARTRVTVRPGEIAFGELRLDWQPERYRETTVRSAPRPPSAPLDAAACPLRGPRCGPV